MRRIHYAWMVAGVAFLALLVSAGVRATPGVLIVPLEREFGITVIAASQACVWDALRLAGVHDRIEGYGRLLREF